jgi:hypothetical protein
MSNVFLSAVLLSSLLAVSGCMGGLPNLGALGSALGGYPSSYGGGGYPSYGGGQAYGGGYAQPSYAQPGQPYYQPQVYPGNPGVYVYQPNQVPQATGGNPTPPPGYWNDQRRQREEARIEQGLASGHLTQDQANRMRAHLGLNGGTAGQTGTNPNPHTQDPGHHYATQPGSTQNPSWQGHNGGQTVAGQTGGVPAGPTAQSQPTGIARPMAQMGPGGQPQAMMQPRAPMQPRSAMQPRAPMQPRTATPARTTSQPRQARTL